MDIAKRSSEVRCGGNRQKMASRRTSVWLADFARYAQPLHHRQALLLPRCEKDVVMEQNAKVTL
jgi:hypothetical protein